MNELIAFPVKEAIRQIRLPGNVYVNAAITTNDIHLIQVKKSYIIELLNQFDSDIIVGCSSFNDGSEYPAILLDAYGLDQYGKK